MIENDTNTEISLGEVIIILLKFIKKNILLFLIAVFLGAGIGYYKSAKLKPDFESEAIYCSDILESNRLKEIISDFENASKNGNYNFLAQKLNLPLDSVKQILNIEIKTINSNNNYRTDVDLTQSKLHQCIKVICLTTNPNIFSSIEEKLLDVFKQHNETSQIVDQRINGYKRTLERINNDIKFLTEQRINMYNQLENGKGNIDINQFDNEGHFIHAYNNTLKIEELISRTKAAVLMKPFNKLTMAFYNKKKEIALMSLIFLSTAIVVGIFREIKL